MACALNIALSGPRSYAGDLKDDYLYPFVNADGIRGLGANQITEAVRILIPTAFVACGFGAAAALFQFVQHTPDSFCRLLKAHVILRVSPLAS